MITQIQQAIDCALCCQWEDAVDLNLQILEKTPNDIATLNRLAKCYLQLSDKKSAKATYQKVLSLDKYNTVALKNLKTLSLTTTIESQELCQEDFVESSGLTRTSSLIKVADRNILAGLYCKQKLLLKPKAKLISVTTTNGTYIGSLPDDLSHKMKQYLTNGYLYQVCLKNSTDNMASIFIRETKRPNKKNALPSFNRAHIRFNI